MNDDQPRNEDPSQAPIAEQDGEQTLPIDQPGEGQVNEDPVDDASEDSFPASDPPSFTGGTTT